MSDGNFIDLSAIFAVIRRWWWIIAGCALLLAVLAYIGTSFIPPVYESTVMLLVNPSKGSNATQYNDLMAGTQLALTYSQMVKDRPVLEKVISDLGLKRSADDLAKHITAEPVRNSQIIKLTVTNSDSGQAALIANTLADAFTKRVEELSARRYAGSIESAKKRVEDLQGQIKTLQAQIDTIRSQKVSKDVALANKQTLLNTQQSDYRSLQNSYQSMQLTVAEVTGRVYIVEPAQSQQDPYQSLKSATSVVSVVPAQLNSGNGLTEDRLALTYGKLLIKPALLQGVIKELGLTETPDDLEKKISFDLVPGTQLIRFTVQDTDELKAQLIAQSLVNAFVAQVKALLSEPYSDQLESMKKQISNLDDAIKVNQTEIGSLTSEIAQTSADLNQLETDLTTARNDYREALQNYEKIKTTAVEASDSVLVTEPAQPAKHPSQNKMLYVVVAGFIGLVIGSAIAFLLKYADSKLRTGQDVLATLNMAVFSTIGQLSKAEEGLVMDSAPTSKIAEDFRVLGNKIRLISEHNSLKTLLVTSPAPSEGKSTIAANLAIGLSKTGLRVVLVDADLRLPRVHNLFGIAQEEGLTNSLSKGNINGTLKSTSIGELKILTSGQLPTNPAEVLSSPDLQKLLQELKGKADLVIIDCPPVLVASDTSIIAPKADGILLVLRAGYTESKMAKNALEALQQVKGNLVGVILNSVPDQQIGGYYHYRYDRPVNR